MDLKGVVYPRIKINTCDPDELLKLPGIGPQTAKRIVHLRQQQPLDWEKLIKIQYVKPTNELFQSVDFSMPTDTFSDLAKFLQGGQTQHDIMQPHVVPPTDIKGENYDSDVSKLSQAMGGITLQQQPKQQYIESTQIFDP